MFKSWINKQGQDEDVLTTFVRVYQRDIEVITRRITSLTGDRDLADDIVAAATLRMLTLIRRGKVEPGEESVQKLYQTILTGKRRDAARKDSAERRLREELTRQALNTAEPQAGRRLTDLLAPLNLGQADLDLLRLRYELGWDYVQVADALAISPAAARKRVSRLLAKLGVKLEADLISYLQADVVL